LTNEDLSCPAYGSSEEGSESGLRTGREGSDVRSGSGHAFLEVGEEGTRGSNDGMRERVKVFRFPVFESHCKLSRLEILRA
jgi:hypothetical protein